MDAKAKVVAWQWRYICLEEWQPCTEEFAQAIKSDVRCETRALIPLTDHEAALAELQKVIDRTRTDAQLGLQTELWVLSNCHFTGEPPYVGNHGVMLALAELKAAKDSAESKLTTLLTGLEALAGEWKRLAEQHESSSENCGMPFRSEWHAGMSEGIADCAEELRTLASAGLEGK